MARDHRKLRVFHLAHELTLAIYKDTRNFPRDEWFGLRQQLRRAAVSVPANLVEGSARRGGGEYCHFINIARGSASEVQSSLDWRRSSATSPAPLPNHSSSAAQI